MKALLVAIILLSGCDSIKGYVEDKAMAEAIVKEKSSRCASDDDKASLDSIIFEAME